MMVPEDVECNTLLNFTDDSVLQVELYAHNHYHHHLNMHKMDHNEDKYNLKLKLNHDLTWYNCHNIFASFIVYNKSRL